MSEKSEDKNMGWSFSNKFGLMYWKLAIWKLFSGSFIVVATGIIGATAAVDWENLHPKEKFLIILTISIALVKHVDAFLDQTLARLVAGKPPIQLPGTNGTTHVETTTKTETTIKPKTP